MATYFYVVADDNRNIVTGVTCNLVGAMVMLTSGEDEQTSSTRLVFARNFETLQDALDFETYFFRLSARKRTLLIEAVNPNWQNWADDLFPALAGMAYAKETSDELNRWLDEDTDDPVGQGDRTPFAPFDPVLAIASVTKDDEPTWTSVS